MVRTNKLGAEIAQHLLDKGVTPQTEDSLHVGRHPAALAVVALTRWVLEPHEDGHATSWLQCMAALEPIRIHETEILDRHVVLKINEEGKTYREFDAKSMIETLYPELNALDQSRGPLVSWIGHACQALGVLGRFDAYAESLMELAQDVTGTEDSGLRGFLRAWDRQGHRRSIVASGGRDAVQVMTVHKAKGLAFPVTMVVASDNHISGSQGARPVVLEDSLGLELPAALLNVHDMKDTALDSRAEEELDQALLDQINIMYVGMTRPIERLDVLAELKKLDFDRNVPSTSVSGLLPARRRSLASHLKLLVNSWNGEQAIDLYSRRRPVLITCCIPALWNGKILRRKQSGWRLEAAPKFIPMD